ncbi:fd732be6-2ce2-44fd-9039-4ab52b6fba1e [Sclerotinia trifoliorum]|uniref:glucan endo-1,6-beta-glucosidase n=1 Tax=Sclerotinia trifoliorum TaxID=28548 RepID=A0A8H2W2S6_9HELO|nr:fd732be6-2ce2-44fd-9039-4ab52b6fba1e [Sclerotinia trifoliorum]
MYISTTLLTAFLASTVSAWLPGDKELRSKEGVSLFDPQAKNSTTRRWTPASGKIRGVNLGSLFVFEPWIAEDAWSAMGCGPYASEFDCVSGLGQAKANSAFQNHWKTWITADDIAQMASFGINTVRIPVGYWIMESLVYSDSEHFPQGGLRYLESICDAAANAGFYIIIDMHGAPGAQVAYNADTGQNAPTPGFYVDYQYARGEKFVSWLATNIHQNNALRNVGMIGIVNEPVQDAGKAADMISTYYPAAYKAIRDAENALGVTSNNYLHVQAMDQGWGSGDPNSGFGDGVFLAYDEHRYLKWSTVSVSKEAYLKSSCTYDPISSTGGPTVVGEFSISPPDDVQDNGDWSTSTQGAFYKKWFKAQVMGYENHALGWIFWTWKSQLNDYRWSYQDAVRAGIIPKDLDSVAGSGACNGY